MSKENITKVWRRNKPTTDTSDNYSLFDEYTYEIQLKDYLKVKLDLPREYSETIINELENTKFIFRIRIKLRKVCFLS